MKPFGDPFDTRPLWARQVDTNIGMASGHKGIPPLCMRLTHVYGRCGRKSEPGDEVEVSPACLVEYDVARNSVRHGLQPVGVLQRRLDMGGRAARRLNEKRECPAGPAEVERNCAFRSAVSQRPDCPAIRPK